LLLPRTFAARVPRAPLALALLPGIVLAVWYALSASRVAGTLGFPLDDSWIHAQFARNIATGHGFSYTGGRAVSGSTAPLWTLVLAAVYLVVRNIVTAALIAGVACQLAAGYYAVRLALLFESTRVVALLAGTITVVMPVMVWGAVSGMEVPLAAALVLAGLYHYLRAAEVAAGQRRLGAALLGLSALARPESLAIAAIVVCGEWLRPGPFKGRARRFVEGSAIVAVAFAPLVLFSWFTIGHPLPTTFYAKSGPGILQAIETRNGAMLARDLLVFGPDAVKNFGLILLDQFSWPAWLLVPAVLGVLMARDVRPIGLVLCAILALVPFAMGLTAPQRLKPDNVRYAAQLVVIAVPLLAAGMSRLLRRPVIAAVVLGVATVITAARTVEGVGAYTGAVKTIQQLQVLAGRWIAANLPANAVVAVNDVGAIAYFGNRRILDLEGLVSPEVLPYRRFTDRGLRTVTDFRPDYIVIFPHWYPDIAGSPQFVEMRSIRVAENFISAGDTLVVYRTPWARIP
jgi:arabinofuranosyltransferase